MVGNLPVTLLDTHVNQNEYTGGPEIRVQPTRLLSGLQSRLAQSVENTGMPIQSSMSNVN